MTDHEATLMLDSDTASSAPSSRRSLGWLLAGGVVGLVGVGCFSRRGEEQASLKATSRLFEQAENCASGGQPSSCPDTEVAKMTSYGAWTVCGPNAGLPTQTGVFVGGIEACEAKCTGSSTCRGVQWVQGADSTQDICFEISDNICVHHTMTPPVAQGSVPPVQNAECIVKSCGEGGECVAGQKQCCPASLKREVNVAGDKLVRRFARRLQANQAIIGDTARVVKAADGTVLVCNYPRTQGTARPLTQLFAVATVSEVGGQGITQTLNPHLKVEYVNNVYNVVRYDPADPNNPVIVGTATPVPQNTQIPCPLEVQQFGGRKQVCAVGDLYPTGTVPAGCNLPLPAGWKVGVANNIPVLQDATGTAIPGCTISPLNAADNALCETLVFAAADHNAIVCDANLNVLGMVNTVPTDVEVDTRATVKFSPDFTKAIVENPLSADGGKRNLGTVIRNTVLATGEHVGVWNCAGITCGTSSTCQAIVPSTPGKWRGLLCVGVSPLPASLRGVFWKVNEGVGDHFPFIPDVIAFCQNTDGCGKSLGHINAEGELLVDLRGEKVVDWLGTTVDIDDTKALTWIRENGHCKLTFSSVPGKGSRHSPTWFSIEASCDPTESGANVNIPTYVTDQIAAFNKEEPFMVWVHGSRYNSMLPRGCTAWALWRGLDQKRTLAQDAVEVTTLDKTTSRLVSIVDDRGYTLEECGYARFDTLYGKSSVIHYTFDNRR